MSRQTRPPYSLHLTDADRTAYIREYWEGGPNEIPVEYTRPRGSPYFAEVDAKTFAAVKASKNGIRRFSGPLPGDGGTDGWIPMSMSSRA